VREESFETVKDPKRAEMDSDIKEDGMMKMAKTEKPKDPKQYLERTLVILKPDAVQRAFVGRIIQRFEDAGMKIIGMKMTWVTKEFGKRHYNDLAKRRGEAVLQRMLNYITEGPVIAFVLEGISAVEQVRKMTGSTEPKSAMPGTIRGDFSHYSYDVGDAKNTGVKNLIHASGSLDEAKFEIALWFAPEELHTYKTVHEVHTL
jgi:nucleoside-diphosphate kinase